MIPAEVLPLLSLIVFTPLALLGVWHLLTRKRIRNEKWRTVEPEDYMDT